MNKTDNRMYNRKTNRDLQIEMDLYIALKGKNIDVPGCSFDDKPVNGKIINVTYHPGKSNLCRVDIDNGSEYTIPVKRGKLLLENRVILTPSTPPVSQRQS